MDNTTDTERKDNRMIPALPANMKIGVAWEIEKQRDELLKANEHMAIEMQNLSRLLWLSLFRRGPLRVDPVALYEWDGENRALNKRSDPDRHGCFILTAKEVNPTIELENVIVFPQPKVEHADD